MTMSLMMVLLSVCPAVLYALQSTEHASVDRVMTSTATRAYIIHGDRRRTHSLRRFVHDMGFSPKHVEYVPAVKRIHITSSKFMRSLQQMGFIDNRWIQRYVTTVRDQNNLMSNYGRLALIITMDKIMGKFLASNYSNMLLFEDDVAISPEFSPDTARSLFVSMLDVPSEHWHVQYLGFCYECGNSTNYQHRVVTSSYVNAVFPLCKHAILMSRKLVTLFMNTYKPLTSNKGDWMLHDTLCKYGLNAIRPITPIFVQNTTYQSRLGNFFDKRPFANWVSCNEEESKCLASTRVTMELKSLMTTLKKRPITTYVKLPAS